VPDLKFARRFRTALYQETHLVPERVLADRSLYPFTVSHLLTINGEDRFSALHPGPRQPAAVRDPKLEQSVQLLKRIPNLTPQSLSRSLG
jgi:hypothetical protein